MLSNQSSRETNSKELAKRTDLHLKRKLWHMATGLIALVVTFILNFSKEEAAIASFCIGLMGLLFEGLRLKVPAVNKFFIAFAGPVLRERERNHISGFTFYCFGVSACFFLYSWDIAILSILFLIFADPIASLIGIKYGKTKIFFGKSLEGSSACFLVCCLIGALYGAPKPEISLGGFVILTGVSGTLSELFAFIDDNLMIPIISGFFLSQMTPVLINLS